MSSVVDLTALNDGDSASNLFKRRRSSTLNSHDTDIDQTPSKRVRPCSPCSNHFLFDNHSQMQTLATSLNDILQSHRNLIQEYVQLQMHDRTDLSIDEQRFIQAEEDLIEKAEKNLYDIHHNSPPTSSLPSSRLGKRQRIQSISSMASPVVDRVKHESHILKRIEELKVDGKWTAQRLAKCLEPNKRKTHWDYLLDEMRWLAEDFQCEKRWKKAMAKKISQAVLKYFRDKNQIERNLTKELRQRAQIVSKEVLFFWKNISKIANFKETLRLEENHRHRIDLEENLLNNDATSDEEEEEEDFDTFSLNELKELEEDREMPIEMVLKRRYDLELSDLHDGIEPFFDDDDDENSTKSFEKEILSVNEFVRRVESFRTFDVDFRVSFLVKKPLRQFQHVALQWLMTLASNHFNCIFADQTGLGKKLVTIALLATFASEKRIWRENLIVVPTRRLSQWEIELKKVAPGLKTFVFDGSNAERPTNFNVCLTSYQILRQNFDLFRRKNWFYTIFDRAERLENFRSSPLKILFDLRAENRLFLCEKFQLENKSRAELDSIVEFLVPNVQMTSTDSPIDVLRPLILSRTKFDVENQVERRVETFVFCDLSTRQKKLYEQIQMEKNDFKLKKLCDHPDLIESRSVRSSWTMNDDEFRRISTPKISLKNFSFGFSNLFVEKFFYFHKRFSLQMIDDVEISSQIDDDDDDEMPRIVLTNEIIERYRNSSLWKNDANEFSIKSKRRTADRNEIVEFSPWFGLDTVVQLESAMKPCGKRFRTNFNGYAECFRPVDVFRQLIKFRSDRLDEFQQFFKRFLICSRRVLVKPLENIEYSLDDFVQTSNDSKILSTIVQLENQMSIEFPWRSFFQSDSGKILDQERRFSDKESQSIRHLNDTDE